MMEIKDNKIILEPGDKFTGCGYTIEVREKEEVVPTPPSDKPDQPDEPDQPDVPDTPDTPDTPEPTPPMEGRLSFVELVARFNEVLVETDHNPMAAGMDIFEHLTWLYGFADGQWDTDKLGFFRPMPEVYDYHGDNDSTLVTAYNAMQSWIFAFHLARICPTFGIETNTQTEIYRLAWSLGGGSDMPLYGDYTYKADPYAMRLVGAKIAQYAAGKETDAQRWDLWRGELGGQMIPASCFDELGYEREEVVIDGIRRGYRTKCIGWLVNTSLFLPSAPGPRVDGTLVCEQQQPWEQGQPINLFNPDTGNYYTDEAINDYMVDNFNMMAQTPLEEWEGYPLEKKNRIANCMAVPRCTYNYMFGAPKPIRLVLENGQLPVVDGYNRYVWEVCGESDIVLDGPLSDLAGIFRYNVPEAYRTIHEDTIVKSLSIFDDGRFPTQDPCYGRSRPGCKPSLEREEANPVHGSAENELYNISISCIVADTEQERQKWSQEDGFATDRPNSYVSGHSAQIIGMALLLGGMCPDKLDYWCRRAHEYSVDRSIGRYHWNSDCIYGRLFGTMVLPIIEAMSGMQDGLNAIREWIADPQPAPEPEPEPTGDCRINISIRNESDQTLSLNGELRLILANPDVNGVYHGWEGPYNRTGRIRFSDPTDIAPGITATFLSVSMGNSEIAVRGRNLVTEDVIPATDYKSNVLLYNEDGKSEKIVPEPADPDIIFTDGSELTVVVR